MSLSYLCRKIANIRVHKFLSTTVLLILQDQNDALERFYEIQAELNLVKEKAEQQISQLKENLRLVYGALEESMKKMTPATPLIRI